MSAVLVARLDNVGDVVLAGPAVRAVSAAGRRVVLLCGPRGRAGAELLPGVDELLVWRAPWIDPDPQPVERRDADRLVARVREAGVEEAAILGSSHQSPLPLALLLRWAGVARIGAVSHDYPGSLLDVRIPGDPEVHEVLRGLSVVEAMGYRRPDDDRLRVSTDPADGAATWSSRRPIPNGRPYVVVHPGASVPARTLPPERWRDTVEALVRAGWFVVLSGNGQERRLTAGIAGDQPAVLDLAGETTLRGLCDILRHAAAVVAGNTGPMHLAAAVGAPTVAVFPPTVPLERWRPWRVPHVVLGDQEVACAGCRARRCPLPQQVCLEPVRPVDVVAAVEAVAAPRVEVAPQ